MSDRDEIYNYIKREINPYGKPFKGSVTKFGVKIMDYIENMSNDTDWIPASKELPPNASPVLCRVKDITISETETYAIGSCHNGCWFFQSDTVGIHSFPALEWRTLAWTPIPIYNEDKIIGEEVQNQENNEVRQNAIAAINAFIAYPDRNALTTQFMEYLKMARDALYEVNR